MRPWRDVMSASDFNTVVQHNSGGWTQDHTNKAKPGLVALYHALQEYHNTDKRSLATIKARRSQLAKISSLAKSWLSHMKIKQASAASRPNNDKRVDERTLPLERVVLTLMRRALRKRKYLEELTKYLKKGMSISEMLRLASSEQVRHEDGSIELISKVLLEKEDPWHRDGFEGGDLADAFRDWSQQGGTTPFFLWLEGHEICTTSDKTSGAVQFTTSVEYVGTKGKPSLVSKMCLLELVHGNLRAIDLTGKKKTASVICDTYQAAYTSSSQKSISKTNTHGRGLACFVWSVTNEIYIAQHEAGHFHHSSLLAGSAVKCAGMIGIKNGMAVEVSNNSGHYQPRLDEFLDFMRFLVRAGAASDSTEICVAGNRSYIGTWGKFNKMGGHRG